MRTIQDEINELKKQVKPAPAAVLSSGGEEASPPTPPSPLESKIQQLTEVDTMISLIIIILIISGVSLFFSLAGIIPAGKEKSDKRIVQR